MSHQQSDLLRRLRTYAALVLLPAHLAACSNVWVGATLNDLEPEPVNRVRFYTADAPEDRVELRDAHVMGDSLIGLASGRDIPVPERRSFSSQTLLSLQKWTSAGQKEAGGFVAALVLVPLAIAAAVVVAAGLPEN